MEKTMNLKRLLTDVKTNSEIPDIEIMGVCYDSRKVTAGCMFICLTGGAADGHNFAKSAAEGGAAVIVAERMTDANAPHIIVDDTRRAMFDISANWFDNPQRKMKFLGVTGTNGKTSTVYYIKEILSGLSKKVGLIGTVNNMIGDKVLPSNSTTPEPLELMGLLSEMHSEGCEYVVMEVSSHSIVQKRVCGIDFLAVAFTNLTQDHLDYHGTMENYKAAKREIFDFCENAVINIDDATGREYLGSITCNKITYSALYNSADLVAKDPKIRANGVKFLAVTKGGISKVSVRTPGTFTVSNVLAAIAVCLAAGFDLADMALGNVSGVLGRAQIISGERDYTVMIDYAHTPDGIENILRSVKEYAEGRIVTLFGCGGDRDKTKRAIMGDVAARLSDFVVVTSDNPRTEDPDSIIADILPGVENNKTPFVVIPDRRKAIEYVIANAKPRDMIVLAGKGHEKYQILGKEKIDFDEEAIALSFMEKYEK